MRRKIYQELLQWKQRSGESALLVQRELLLQVAPPAGA